MSRVLITLTAEPCVFAAEGAWIQMVHVLFLYSQCTGCNPPLKMHFTLQYQCKKCGATLENVNIHFYDSPQIKFITNWDTCDQNIIHIPVHTNNFQICIRKIIL